MYRKKEGFAGQRSYVLPAELKKQITAHPLCESLYITNIGYYPKAAFHDRERRKGCPQHILIYCVQGEGWYYLNDKKYRVKPNQAFILPADSAHRYGTDAQNPWTIYWLHFAGSRAHHFLRFLQQEADPSPVTVSPQNERFLLFDDIFSHVEMSFNMDNIVYANTSLARFLATFNNAVYNPNPVIQPTADPISRSIAFMKANLSRPLDLDELAQVAGMSASHYSAVFRSKVQSAPINFFTFLKIQEACRQLENTQLRIKEVAYQIGYSDPYHFSRVFTNMMGVSPRDFRKLRKG
ncbi:AraC family transcriptional regulator [Spirosoma utsteinense]|uniref:AraC-like DNA-binding protein n=1 Tax=Spirosoma utsteinense TaxID=2585773 RepID=A0ABR6VZD6_9BACT|nr:AraC family transcriptional regulator [Spirosoma utsteinense]MBC3784638.1 AraC-like DNA-binding protein [Spirosoma utsteinense]MBC3789609.1 AraC-like DNA-binding protein [Spirosoma utsteinense]